MSGDVEPNPGPLCNFKTTVELFTRGSKSLNFFHVNWQSIAQEKRQVEMLLKDLGNNAIFGFSETWLKEDDSEELWQLNIVFFKTFRSDRKTSLKDKGGGVMLVVPKSLNPKLRKDLNHLKSNPLKAFGSNVI